jgi:formylmethanofuran dehydrogenase subunit A
MSLLKIANGILYDPANGVDGVVMDLWIRDGKIVAAPSAPDERPDKVMDATGLVVMPGGVDMHAHIAGPKVNLARKMRPEDKRRAPVIRRTPQEILKRVHPRVLERCTLKDLDREYSLYEIAIITRAGPARMLGLKHKGHLGVGADADITIYTPQRTARRCSSCRAASSRRAR